MSARSDFQNGRLHANPGEHGGLNGYTTNPPTEQVSGSPESLLDKHPIMAGQVAEKGQTASMDKVHTSDCFTRPQNDSYTQTAVTYHKDMGDEHAEKYDEGQKKGVQVRCWRSNR